MNTKALTRRQAQRAETMGCFDFEIIFWPGRQLSKPDALSRRPNLAPHKEDKLTFGQLLRPENVTPDTFAEISKFEGWFQDETIEMDDADYWFQLDILGVDPHNRGVTDLSSDMAIIECIRMLTPSDPRLPKLTTQERVDSGSHTWKDGIVYSKGRIEVPSCDTIKHTIVKSRHNSLLAGHPSQAKTLALVRRCFTWPAMKQFVNCYVEGCDSCQRTKSSTLKPLGTLEPLPIPAGPWTDISYDMITDLPISAGHDTILTVIDRLTKMAHFIACKKTMTTNQLADLMI
jgi:hypothetical protein